MLIKNWGQKVAFIENVIGLLILSILTILPITEFVLRKVFQTGLLGAYDYVLYLVLWVTFIGGIITTRERQHLSIATLAEKVKGTPKKFLTGFNTFIACTICISLCWSALSAFLGAFGEKQVGIFPIQVFVIILPLGYLLMGIRFVTSASLGIKGKLLASTGIIVGSFIAFPSLVKIVFGMEAVSFGEIPPLVENLYSVWYGVMSNLTLPLIILLILSAFLGEPLFIVLGGIAYFLFAQSFPTMIDEYFEAIPLATNTMLTGDNIAAIPLFALVGFILSESKAGERLIKLFKSLFGWIPGGLVIMTVLVCAFFTTFTGASGVTILALGGVLYYALAQKSSYSESYSTGLLTASGSIGLLFPPSLVIILYASKAMVSVLDMFIAGLVPGVLMLLVMSGTGIFMSLRQKIAPSPFKLKEALASIKESAFEILLPLFIFVLYFGGITTLVETSAFSVIYVFITEVLVRKEIALKDFMKVIVKAVIIIGGVLVILGTANALAEFIKVQQVHNILFAWMKNNIHSPILFLLMLNIALLITGCFMDIFSAIIVVVPLILPLVGAGGVYPEISPIHLGIIFIVNMEIGFLTPPIGLNLFLASYRFEKTIGRVYKNVIPFLALQTGLLLIITYIPWLSTGLLDFVRSIK
jgi:C4-dicarboxylate transporter DctM subunit